MLKKVTTYLPEKDVRALKRLSSKKKTSMAHLVREGVQLLCSEATASRKGVKKMPSAWQLLEGIHKNIKGEPATDAQIMKWALQAQKEVRHEMAKERSGRR